MTTTQPRKEPKRQVPPSKSGSDESSAVPSLAAGVTGSNYTVKALAFMQLRKREDGTMGHMVSTENRLLRHGDKLVQTLHEFGAWRAYLRRLGLRYAVKSMDEIGYYMVPAQWPHDFDAGVSAATSFADGNAFNEDYHAMRANLASRVQRIASAAAARAKFPRGTFHKPHAPPPAKFDSSEDLRTPPSPPSDELKRTMKKPDEKHPE